MGGNAGYTLLAHLSPLGFVKNVVLEAKHGEVACDRGAPMTCRDGNSSYEVFKFGFQAMSCLIRVARNFHPKDLITRVAWPVPE